MSTPVLYEVLGQNAVQYEVSRDIFTSQRDAEIFQTKLNNLLGIALKPDGDLGSITSKSMTREAIGIFQSLARLPITRKVDEATVRRLDHLERLNSLPGPKRRFVFDEFEFREASMIKKHRQEICNCKNALQAHLRRQSADTIFIHGHTDHVGSRSFNRTLGMKRAEEIGRHLLTAWFCDPRTGRLFDLSKMPGHRASFGEDHPIRGTSPKRKSDRARNRRVVIVLLKTKP